MLPSKIDQMKASHETGSEANFGFGRALMPSCLGMLPPKAAFFSFWMQPMWETHSESAHGHCLGALFSSAQRMAFAVLLLLAVIKQRCIAVGAPFWIGGELPVFVVRPHAPNRDVRTVTVRYESGADWDKISGWEISHSSRPSHIPTPNSETWTNPISLFVWPSHKKV